jgi:Domain of unknown function (DUF4406)
MTGFPDFNYPAFFAEAERLRAAGHTVNNPAEAGVESGASWEDYLRRDIVSLMACDAIHMLPGWSRSKGARLEHHIALELGFTVTGAPE